MGLAIEVIFFSFLRSFSTIQLTNCWYPTVVANCFTRARYSIHVRYLILFLPTCPFCFGTISILLSFSCLFIFTSLSCLNYLFSSLVGSIITYSSCSMHGSICPKPEDVATANSIMSSFTALLLSVAVLADLLFLFR